MDASDVGVGAVLLQEGKDDIDLPNCYFFLKNLIRKNNPQLKKMACPIVAIMMYMSSIRDVY